TLPAFLAFQHPALGFVGEIAIGHVERDAALLGVLHQVVLAFPEAFRLPGTDRAFAQRLAFVRNDEAVVDADHPPEAAAFLAGAERGVEGEMRRRRPRVVDVAVCAMQAGAVTPAVPRRAFVVHHVDVNVALAHLERRLERLDYARPFGVAETEAVLDRKSTRLNSSHVKISYAVFCL